MLGIINIAVVIQASTPALVLASQSVTRAGVLHAAGLRFEQRPAQIDEAAVKDSLRGEGADECALTLAGLKAARIRDPDALVIGADQLLVCESEWFDKPPDPIAARSVSAQPRASTDWPCRVMRIA